MNNILKHYKDKFLSQKRLNQGYLNDHHQLKSCVVCVPLHTITYQILPLYMNEEGSICNTKSQIEIDALNETAMCYS